MSENKHAPIIYRVAEIKYGTGFSDDAGFVILEDYRALTARCAELEKALAGLNMIQIAVITNGFVYVGNVQPVRRGIVKILNAWNIRQWGTTRGLGEIALGGPTKKTILDRAGTVRVPYHSLIMLLDCEVKPWRRALD